MTRNIWVTVFDSDPVRMTQALAQGFRSAADRFDAVSGAGLVVCATGNGSLRFDDFRRLRNGAHVVSVTSSEDELDLAEVHGLYQRSAVGQHVTRYSDGGHFFHLLNDGNAVNFLHEAVVGPFIFLVQAEILAAVSLLARGDLAGGYHEVGDGERRFIAKTWLDHFSR